MNPDQYSGEFRSHNAVATFDERRTAQSVMDQLQRTIPRNHVRIKPADQEAVVDYAEIRDEVEEFVGGPGVTMTGSQAQGAFGGGLLFAGIGAVLGVVAGFIWHSMAPGTTSLLMKIVIGAVCAGFGGGIFGFQAGGSFKPRTRPGSNKGEYEGGPRREGAASTPSESGKISVEVHTDASDEFLKAVDILERADPHRLDTFNERGEVISTKTVGEGRSDAEGPPPARDLGV